MVSRRLIILGLVAAGLCSAAQVKRIVSTTPSITEMLYALGLGDRVVGVTTYCKYPADARNKTKIGTFIDPNLEKIASLRPDLVIIQHNPVRLADKLRNLHLNVLEIGHDNVEEVYQSMQRVGDAAGISAQARKKIADLRAQVDAVRRQTAGKPKVKMMFVIGRTPNRLEDIIVVGRASYLNDLIETAGGENVFKNASTPYPKVGMEEILARNPQVIVDMGDMPDTELVTEAHKKAAAELWKRAPSVAAVRNGRVYAVAADIFTVPGPRMAEGARLFLELLRP